LGFSPDTAVATCMAVFRCYAQGMGVAKWGGRLQASGAMINST
jgi:hypothetical protein